MSVSNTYQVKVDIKKKPTTKAPEVIANDKVVFEVEVFDNGALFTLDESYIYYLVSKSYKKDANAVIRQGTLTNGKIVFALGSSEFEHIGKVEATVQIFDSTNERVSTAYFDYKVEKDNSFEGELPNDEKNLVIVNESILNDTIETVVGFSEQLAETEAKQKKLINAEKTTNKLYVTLMDDDGRIEAFTVLKPILDELNVKMSFAINVGLVGTSGFMSWAQIEQLKAEGHEILNHTKGSDGLSIQTKTLEQIKMDYELEKSEFINHGLDTYDYLVYSGVMPWQDVETRKKINAVYKCCFGNADSPDNMLPFDNFAIQRKSLTYNAIQTIDSYIEKGSGYLVLFQHANQYTSADLTTLRNVINYLKTKEIEFVTGKYMIDNFSNVLNLGNLGQEKFLVDKNGNIDFSIDGRGIRELTNVFYENTNFSGKTITEYRKNSITIEKVGGSYADFWLPQSGTIRTYRFDDDRFSFQEFSILNGVEVWKRNWDTTANSWQPFSPVSGISVTTDNRPKFIKRGIMIHDATLGKPIWPQADGYGVAYVQIARSTSYKVGTYVNTTTDSGATNNRLYECIVEGITSDTRPIYPTTKGQIVIDGTAEFKYIGDRVIYRDANGTVVT